MTCEMIRETMVEALYGELDDRQRVEFEGHLEGCPACSVEYADLRGTLDLVNRRERVEPTTAGWSAFDRRLEERLSRETSPATRTGMIRFLPAFRPAWGYGIAAVLLIGFGIYMGRTVFNGSIPGIPGGETQGIAGRTDGSGEGHGGGDLPGGLDASDGTRADGESVGDRTATAVDAGGRDGGGGGGRTPAGLAPSATPERRTPGVPDPEADALAYLERSRNLLIGLTNLDDPQASGIDLEIRARVSRELYDRGSILTVALNRPSQQQLRLLVEQLQLILLQLSNVGMEDGRPAVELVRQGVRSESILLRINLEAIRSTLREEDKAAAKDSAGKSL